MRPIAALILFMFSHTMAVQAQQVPDSTYIVEIADPMYAEGDGPLVLIDGSHGNFHKMDGRFMAFANVLKADGYRVEALNSEIEENALADAEILVIANSLHPSNLQQWALPTPSAFSEKEIDIIVNWVKEGGKLFLIADHMPFPGAVSGLAQSFGATWENNFALDKRKRRPEIYSKANGQLEDHPVTSGKEGYLPVDSVAVFTGSAFVLPVNAHPVMRVDEHYALLSPEQAWQFTEDTPSKPGTGYVQGATLGFGEGKVVLWGEAAMLSAQLAGPEGQFKMGMNAPEAGNNHKLLLNLVRWLDR